MDNLAQIFSLLDTDQKDYITESDLRTASNLQNNGNIDDIIKLLNIKNSERLTLHQFCQRIHGIHYQEDYSSLDSKQNQYEEIFEGQGETRIKSSNIKHQRESNNTTQEFSDSVLRQIVSLLEDLRNEQDMRKRMENLEYEKSNLLLRLEMSQERADGLEKQLLDTQDVVRSSRKDLITLQRNFEVVSNLADDLKNEKNSLKDKLELLRQEGHANNASLNRQRELLHQDRLAFTHQRIAFDNHTMAIVNLNQSKAASASAASTKAAEQPPTNTGQKCAAVEVAPCCNKSSLKKKVLSDSKKHTFSKPLTQLTVEGQTHDISLLMEESFEIEKDQSGYNKNEESENSIMSHERRGRVTNLFANKAFYIPSPKPNGHLKYQK